MLTAADIAAGTGQAALAASLATCLAAILVRGLPVRRGGFFGVLAWGMLIATAASPGLMVGYAYSPLLLPLFHYPELRGIVYAFLTAAKFTPALVLVLALLPSQLTAGGLHALSLSRSNLAKRIKFKAYWPRLLTAFCLGFVLAFNEFDIAAILGTTAWSVSVFDAHAGGLPGSESLRLAMTAVAVQLPIVVIGLIALRQALMHRPSRGYERSPSYPSSFVAWVGVILIFGLIVLGPVVIVFEEALGGLSQAVVQFGFGKNIFASVYLGAAAALLAYMIARWLSRKPRLALATALPCLSGALLIGLAVLGSTQAAFPKLQSGPVPVVMALTLAVLPAAIVLNMLLRATGRTGQVLEARRSGDARLRWRYVIAPAIGVSAIIFLMAYFEVVIPSLLAPPGMTTAFERLHNLMHYGRTTALSATVVLAFVAPLILVVSLWLPRLGICLISSKGRAR